MNKIKLPKETIKEIDWDENQYVICDDLIIAVTGKGYSPSSDSPLNNKYFAGWCFPCKMYPKGKYDTHWQKIYFKRLEIRILYEIKNSQNK